jgi:hypothetical protein
MRVSLLRTDMIMNSNQRRLQDEPVVTDGTVEELRKTTRNKSPATGTPRELNTTQLYACS